MNAFLITNLTQHSEIDLSLMWTPPPPQETGISCRNKGHPIAVCPVTADQAVPPRDFLMWSSWKEINLPGVLRCAALCWCLQGGTEPLQLSRVAITQELQLLPPFFCCSWNGAKHMQMAASSCSKLVKASLFRSYCTLQPELLHLQLLLTTLLLVSFPSSLTF